MLKLLAAGMKLNAPQILLPSTNWVMLPSDELVYVDSKLLYEKVKAKIDN